MKCGVWWAVGVAAVWASGVAAAEPTTLTAFGTTEALAAHVAAHAPQDAAQDPDCPPEWEVCEDYDAVDEVVVTGSRVTAPSITNNQEAGVDEGDIVKMRGDTLIILRRGRLFTIDTAGGGLRAVDRIDAYPPGVNPEEDWYDEMLVADDWVVVVGYSCGRGGTEINRFRLDRRGRLTFVDSHHLTSDDYYSSRNYASRLIGERLVIYSPLYVSRGEAPLDQLPALTRWSGEGRPGISRPLVRPQDVHRAPPLPNGSPAPAEAIHAVTFCDLTRPQLHCEGVAIVGPASRSFYVGPGGVYIWMTADDRRGSDAMSAAFLYRVPFDGGRPQAARVWGAPIDQMSFAEDGGARVLRVLVRAEGDGDAIWSAEISSGDLALLTLPFERLGNGLAAARPEDYRALPATPDNAWGLVNRFTETHLLYAISEGSSLITSVPLDGGRPGAFLMEGEVERIEPVGRDALVVNRLPGAVLFSTISLVADLTRPWLSGPRIADQHRQDGVQGAETRSHAFFYQPDPQSLDGEFGLMGLPVFEQIEDEQSLPQTFDGPLFDRSADMLFLRRGNDRVRPAGLLASNPASQTDDGCLASCVDWYGDARPIFARGRVFALLGYELVEGRDAKGRISEVRRIDFAPEARPGPRP